MIGEQLQRNHGQNRHQTFRCVRHGNDLLGDSLELFRAITARECEDRAFARFDLFHVVEVFREHRVVRRNEDRRQVWPNQRDDTVFQLSAGMTLRKQVSDLLHLERAFERDREIELPPEEQHPADIGMSFCDHFDLIAQLQNFFDLRG